VSKTAVLPDSLPVMMLACLDLANSKSAPRIEVCFVVEMALLQSFFCDK
jgi:hypothetical protein